MLVLLGFALRHALSSAFLALLWLSPMLDKFVLLRRALIGFARCLALLLCWLLPCFRLQPYVVCFHVLLFVSRFLRGPLHVEEKQARMMIVIVVISYVCHVGAMASYIRSYIRRRAKSEASDCSYTYEEGRATQSHKVKVRQRRATSRFKIKV